MDRARVGLVGCGVISKTYLSSYFRDFDIIACSDIMPENAQQRADEFGIKAVPVEDTYTHPDIDTILNLTIPAAHYEVTLAAIKAGKSVYSEKPLALAFNEGLEIVNLAEESGVRVGCAPDTFLGGGLQASRQVIDEGVIGQPIAAIANFLSHGHEHWHPNPDFYYQPGGGPMFDLGPYYITALVTLLGPATSVFGSAKKSLETRTLKAGKRAGESIPVDIETHVTGIIEFESGITATVITSFDVWPSRAQLVNRLVVYGTEGTLFAPDPNTFDGPVSIRIGDDTSELEIGLNRMFIDNCRGLGLADMAAAIREDRPHLASAELALHVLEIMEAFHISAKSGEKIALLSRCNRPVPLEEVY